MDEPAEDREESMEEVEKAHCEKSNDEDETSQMQEERIQERRRRDCFGVLGPGGRWRSLSTEYSVLVER